MAAHLEGMAGALSEQQGPPAASGVWLDAARLSPPGKDRLRRLQRAADELATVRQVDETEVTTSSPGRRPVTKASLTPSRQRMETLVSGVRYHMDQVDSSCAPGMLLSWCENSLSGAEVDVRQLAQTNRPPSTRSDLHRLAANLRAVDAADPHMSVADSEWRTIVRDIIDKADVSRGFPMHV